MYNRKYTAASGSLLRVRKIKQASDECGQRSHHRRNIRNISQQNANNTHLPDIHNRKYTSASGSSLRAWKIKQASWSEKSSPKGNRNIPQKRVWVNRQRRIRISYLPTKSNKITHLRHKCIQKFHYKSSRYRSCSGHSRTACSSSRRQLLQLRMPHEERVAACSLQTLLGRRWWRLLLLLWVGGAALKIWKRRQRARVGDVTRATTTKYRLQWTYLSGHSAWNSAEEHEGGGGEELEFHGIELLFGCLISKQNYETNRRENNTRMEAKFDQKNMHL